jgi:hypothetical protein
VLSQVSTGLEDPNIQAAKKALEAVK